MSRLMWDVSGGTYVVNPDTLSSTPYRRWSDGVLVIGVPFVA